MVYSSPTSLMPTIPPPIRSSVNSAHSSEVTWSAFFGWMPSTLLEYFSGLAGSFTNSACKFVNMGCSVFFPLECVVQGLLSPCVSNFVSDYAVQFFFLWHIPVRAGAKWSCQVLCESPNILLYSHPPANPRTYGNDNGFHRDESILPSPLQTPMGLPSHIQLGLDRTLWGEGFQSNPDMGHTSPLKLCVCLERCICKHHRPSPYAAWWDSILSLSPRRWSTSTYPPTPRIKILLSNLNWWRSWQAGMV